MELLESFEESSLTSPDFRSFSSFMGASSFAAALDAEEGGGVDDRILVEMEDKAIRGARSPWAASELASDAFRDSVVLGSGTESLMIQDTENRIKSNQIKSNQKNAKLEVQITEVIKE